MTDPSPAAASAPTSSPQVALGPASPSWARDAVSAGGGALAERVEAADALVWLEPHDVDGLADSLARGSQLRWVQLPFAGVEAMTSRGLVTADRLWTSAKGAYAEPVAEHAMLLAQAGLRALPTRLRTERWGEPAGLSLFDAPVTILGGGGIATCLLGLLAPYRAEVTVVRRSPEPVAGAARTLTIDRLADALPAALVVVLALALTPETTGLIGADQLELMGRHSWLVNVARGRHVRTDDLVAVLEAGRIGGAALDVTDPEPLPDGHPLWRLPNAIVTPHTADTPEMVRRLLAERITDNVARFAAGEALTGLVDPAAGY